MGMCCVRKRYCCNHVAEYYLILSDSSLKTLVIPVTVLGNKLFILRYFNDSASSVEIVIYGMRYKIING